MSHKRKYDPEFKREAVQLVVNEGLTIREVERNLGITHGVLKGLVQKNHDHQDAAFVGSIAPQSPKLNSDGCKKKRTNAARARHPKKRSGHLLDGPASIFGFITEHRSVFGV